jgi:serine phosphatase RsbU (regulator of sigma subunit)
LVVVVLIVALGAAIAHQWMDTDKSRDVALWLAFAGPYAFVAALIMPWNASAAAAATLPAFVAWLFALFVVPNGSLDPFGRVALSFAGAMVAALPIWLGYLTQRRGEEDEERAALSREVSHTRDELGRARIVHDAMFRPPLEDGPVEVRYHYDPLREIGGDFVHIVRDARSGRVTVTVIDVSGHGLAAALTVNRLFGELERVVAEARGDVTPASLLTQLNRYIHLTMTAHSMFATAACVQADPEAKEIRWVVAGHPPPILRHRDGTTERLHCTTLVLGAAPPEEFDPEEQCRPARPGDSVILYTDGVFEARSPKGDRFGLRRLEESVASDPPPRDFTTFLANLVARHHEGVAEDDLLVCQLTYRGAVRTVPAAGHADGVSENDAAAAR